MTSQEQAFQSGLVFSNGSNDEIPQWNENDWPPLLGGWREDHASVVVNHPEKDQAQTVVVLGGWKQHQVTNSVLVLNLDEENKQWQEGPPLNKCRRRHAAVVCNGGVYVIGGRGRGRGGNRISDLDSIERIDVRDLLEASRTKKTSKPGKILNYRLLLASRTNMRLNHWTGLNCRLTEARNGCSAAAVHDRYIVVLGGGNSCHYLASVDIVDTALKSNHTVITGPCMTVARVRCASIVVGHRIYVVGEGDLFLKSVESLEFQPTVNNTKETDASTVFPSSSAWTLHSDLVLSNLTYTHSAVRVGSCIVVAGGDNRCLEVLDTERNIVWNPPLLRTGRERCSMIAVSDGIAVISGDGEDTCETLPLIDRKSNIKVKQLTGLEQNGVIPEDNKVSGYKVGTVQEPELYFPHIGVFYEKLVHPEDIYLQLHEMSFLVSDLTELKVFCSFLNHLRRSKKLVTDDWQRYSLNALHQTCRKISVSDSASIEIFDEIVSQFRKDGIFVNKHIMHSIGINSTSSNVEAQLELSEFRVGQILPLVTPQTAKTGTGFSALMHAQALGRSLKDLCSAVDARDDNHVAVAVICSILNALSFGGPERLHNCAKLSSVNSVLDQIVDYGNLDHLCFVVDQSGNKALQRVCEEGLDIVDRARVVERNDDRSEMENDGIKFLVSAMGLLANGVSKLTRKNSILKSRAEADTHEAVTILALIVTAKIIQMVEPAAQVEGASEKSTNSTEADAMKTVGTNFSTPSLCSAITVVPASRSRGWFRGGKRLREHISSLEGSVAFMVEEMKSDKIANKHVIEHLKSQEKAHAKVVEMMEKLDNRLSKMEECRGYHD